MEANVLPNPEVLHRLQNNFVVVQLVIDDKTELPDSEQSISELMAKTITTLGGKWLNLEITRFKSNSQPFYVLLDSDGNILKDKTGQDIPPSQQIYNVESYLKFFRKRYCSL